MCNQAENAEFTLLKAECANTAFYDLPRPPFLIYGLLGDQDYLRMPEKTARQVSDSVMSLNTNTAGGRIRFQTDSQRITLLCRYPWIGRYVNFCRIGESCFDLYADGQYVGAFLPEQGNMPETPEPVTYRMTITLPDRKMRDMVIHFPSYNAVSRVSVGLDSGAVLLPGKEYRPIHPIVYYGSSITQGGCASHAGNSYQNIIARELNVDYRNLGFSGSCKAEPRMADYLAGLTMSVFVYDYDHNAPDAAYLEVTHEPLFRKIREKQPELPVIFISASDNSFGSSVQARRAVILRTYENALARGDRNVYFIDGRQMYRRVGLELCTVDTCHPNDLGFWCMANTIGSMLKQILLPCGSD